jgi:RNA polymerase sigma factor (sigma-70 family)
MMSDADSPDMPESGPSRSRPLQAVPPAGSSEIDNEFSKFYRDFVPRLIGFLILQGAQLTEATDIVQETMIRAYNRWRTIERPAAWARRVASRELIRRMTSAREEPSENITEGALLLSPSTDIAEWERRHDILHIIPSLPPRQRQVIAWTLDGYSPAEIAEEWQITPEAARANLMKARRTIGERLGHSEGT